GREHGRKPFFRTEVSRQHEVDRDPDPVALHRAVLGPDDRIRARRARCRGAPSEADLRCRARDRKREPAQQTDTPKPLGPPPPALRQKKDTLAPPAAAAVVKPHGLRTLTP